MSWASHQLLRSFICFLVDCIDFKTEACLSLINCCDDSIESRCFDRLVIRQFIFSISVFSSFLISFLMLGRNSVFQIFECCWRWAVLRRKPFLLQSSEVTSPLLATHQARVQYNTVRTQLLFLERLTSSVKEKYAMAFIRLNCNSGGNSPKVRYCALAQKEKLSPCDWKNPLLCFWPYSIIQSFQM